VVAGELAGEVPRDGMQRLLNFSPRARTRPWTRGPAIATVRANRVALDATSPAEFRGLAREARPCCSRPSGAAPDVMPAMAAVGGSPGVWVFACCRNVLVTMLTALGNTNGL
jgi:hypothetical protein